MRDHVGIDYGSYANVYLRINSGEMDIFNNWISPGYWLICKFLGLLDPANYYLMFTVMAFITIYYLLKAIYSMSCNWYLSLAVFLTFCLYYQSFNQFRQLCAIAITTYSCYYLIHGRLKIFLLYVLLAMSIHKSAFIMAGLILVYKLNINWKTLLFYALSCVILNIGYDIFIVRFSALTSYGGYIGSQYDIAGRMSTYLNTAVRLTMIAGCLVFSKRTIERAPYTITFYNIALVCTVLQTLTMRTHIISRMTTYFYVPYIILVPEVLKTMESYFDKASARLIRLSVFILLFTYHYVYFFSAERITEYSMLFFSDLW